ncbi:MAG: helix-turn-helix transcriptional regulator [Ruminococcaceae bacterium]|nr:helix-turn-helix transcriptional regulator [Oscillospiraceae bacterium]
MMTFKEKLIRLRKIKKLTQDEFASAVGVSRQAVYKWESGHSYPEAMKLWEIKLLFDISIDDLLDDTFEVELPEKKRRRRKKTNVEGEVTAAPVAEAVAEPVATVEEAPVVKEEVAEETVAKVEEPVEKPVAEVKPASAKEVKEPVAEVVEEEVVEEEEVEEVVEEVEDVLPPVTQVPENPDRVSDLLQKKGFFGRLFGKK